MAQSHVHKILFICFWNDSVSYNCLLVTYWAIAFRAVTYMSLKLNDAPLRFWFHFTCQICLAIGNVLYLLHYLKILRPRFFFSIFLKSPYPYPHVAFFNRFCPSTRKRNVDRKRHHQLCAFTDIKHRDQNGYMWVGREIRKTDPYPYLRMSKIYLDLLKMP